MAIFGKIKTLLDMQILYDRPAKKIKIRPY